MTLGSLILTAFLATPAAAQDPDEFDLDDLDDLTFEDEEDEETPAPEPAPEPEPQAEDDEALDDFVDPEDDGIDLLGGEEQAVLTGGDTEQLYRSTAARLAALDPDEEMAEWEAYLAQYPQSVFRARIETRMEALMDQLYENNTGGGTGPSAPTDAMRQEIDFAQAMQLENINPRTRLQAGFEWGIPNYFNLILDYEHQLVRTLSIHGGVRRRYSGTSLELGPRWALVKSTRTQTLVTLIGDVHLNASPSYPAFRPQLAIGSRIGKADVQIQGGPDLGFRSFADPVTGAKQSTLQTNIVGGANVYYAASERVGLFAETAVYMRPSAANGAFDGGIFSFNVITMGMKFYPTRATDPDSKDIEANLGATVPYNQQWWQYHYGSIMGQFNYYL
ncbi:MAG TPA: hypothetical protein ENK18_27630 [Deltaproteobacteria bacterium]|nr:hypothetical protein [Deltaproteobacteria bacterium]